MVELSSDGLWRSSKARAMARAALCCEMEERSVISSDKTVI